MAEMAWTTIACLIIALVIHGASAYQFTIGGKAGWVPPTGSDKEIFNHWAEKNRFLIGDTLVFKYNPSVDSLLQVTAQDYNTCTTSNPIKSYNDGNTVFKFPSHGPFYFISGNATNCQMGEKLVTVVLSPRNRSPSPASAPALAPSAVPVMTPTSSPAPTVASPSVVPSPAPTVASPSVVPSPVASPSVVPSPAPTVASPSVVPSPAPTVATPPSPTPVSVPSLSPGAAQPYVSSPPSAVPAGGHATSFAPADSPPCLVSAAVAVVALALSLAV